jgi:PiT family inorganic phosphate transporter
MLWWMLFLSIAAVFAAYANGANDQFKGVATLFGSKITNYRPALLWAVATTAAGSMTACFVAGVTVFFAARAGLPISTTHSLTGALAGSGFMAVGTRLGMQPLIKNFFIPLLGSPFIAVGLTCLLYPLAGAVRKMTGLRGRSCICVVEKDIAVTNLAAPQGAV